MFWERTVQMQSTQLGALIEHSCAVIACSLLTSIFEIETCAPGDCPSSSWPCMLQTALAHRYLLPLPKQGRKLLAET